MAQFLQIGEMGYNVDQIQLINMAGGQTVKIWFLDHPEVEGPTELEGPEADAFRYWWENKADVYAAPVAEEIAVTMQEGEPQPKRDAGPQWTSATLPGRLSSEQRHEDATSNVV